MFGLTDVTVGVVLVTTVTSAVAVTAGSLTEVAVMGTVLAAAGAVYVALSDAPGVARILPTPAVVGTDHVTSWQSVFPGVFTHPGLLTVARKAKCSSVPTVAVLGVIEILMPEIMVTLAEAVFVVSACAVAVTVAVGTIVRVPFVVTVGTVFGAV